MVAYSKEELLNSEWILSTLSVSNFATKMIYVPIRSLALDLNAELFDEALPLLYILILHRIDCLSRFECLFPIQICSRAICLAPLFTGCQ